jgi:hypothetical protein
MGHFTTNKSQNFTTDVDIEINDIGSILGKGIKPGKKLRLFRLVEERT